MSHALYARITLLSAVITCEIRRALYFMIRQNLHARKKMLISLNTQEIASGNVWQNVWKNTALGASACIINSQRVKTDSTNIQIRTGWRRGGISLLCQGGISPLCQCSRQYLFPPRGLKHNRLLNVIEITPGKRRNTSLYQKQRMLINLVFYTIIC
jgi:hypothetical protein